MRFSKLFEKLVNRESVDIAVGGKKGPKWYMDARLSLVKLHIVHNLKRRKSNATFTKKCLKI